MLTLVAITLLTFLLVRGFEAGRMYLSFLPWLNSLDKC